MILRKSIAVLIVLTFIGCGSADSTDPSDATKRNKPTPPAEEELFPFSKAVIYPKGWDKVTIKANSAKTEVGKGAHFTTDRNACGQNAYGAIALKTWNDFSGLLNTTIEILATQPPAPSDHSEICVSGPSDYNDKYVDESVVVKLERGELTLFEYKDGEICSKIRDRNLSNQLLKALTEIIVLADKEDCPNGWGSN